MNKLLSLALAGLLLVSGGCVTNWSQAGADFTSPFNYRLRLAADWIYHPAINGCFAATKDGFRLQQIVIRKSPLTTPLPTSHRVLSATLTPFELAEAMIDDLKADRTLLQLAVEDNTPAKIGGADGFKLVLDYRTADGLHMKSVRHVCLHDGYLYTLIFIAPSRHYFDHDLPDYDAMVRSFAFTAAPKAG